jgi:hypothetical protein
VPSLTIAPLRADIARFNASSFLARPLRTKVSRIEVERIGRKKVVHNKGPGGGWWRSRGSALVAAPSGEGNRREAHHRHRLRHCRPDRRRGGETRGAGCPHPRQETIPRAVFVLGMRPAVS